MVYKKNMQNMPRKRRFYYEMNYERGENMDFLKRVQCKHHIFGFDDQIIKGMIFFANLVTESRLRHLFLNREFVLNFDAKFSVEDYRTMMTHYWEKGEGEVVKRIGSGAGQGTENLGEEPSSIIKQNNILLEIQKDLCDHLMKQNQQLMEQNQCLIEKNSFLETSLKNALTNCGVGGSTGGGIHMTTTNGHNNHIEVNNHHNQSYNINVFLNEQCKHAVTLAEFIKQIVIREDDLFYAKDNGLAEAITNVFERELQNYDVKSRPVHCTDIKRETMHIKADEGWVKELGNHSANGHMKKAIHHLSYKKMSKMKQYFEENPEYKNVQNPDYDDSLKMMRQVMGADESPEKTEKRVLKNISKSVFLDNKRQG
jgi:hypothetical protein